jgi:hypothetical protein
MAAAILPVIIGDLLRCLSRISIHAREVPIGSQPVEAPVYRELRERTVDLAFGPIVGRREDDDLNTELMFNDPSSSQLESKTVRFVTRTPNSRT